MVNQACFHVRLGRRWLIRLVSCYVRQEMVNQACFHVMLGRRWLIRLVSLLG